MNKILEKGNNNFAFLCCKTLQNQKPKKITTKLSPHSPITINYRLQYSSEVV